VAAGVVETGEDVMDHDLQLRHRGTFHEVEYPGIGKMRSHSGAHFLMSKYKYDLAPAPTLGEHNEYVFKQIVGLPDSEYDTLVKDGVID
jgi:crotonobetainyl-CoA:carnitine CoA-transferase CaiB-like acyl-CoA transferase